MSECVNLSPPPFPANLLSIDESLGNFLEANATSRTLLPYRFWTFVHLYL